MIEFGKKSLFRNVMTPLVWLPNSCYNFTPFLHKFCYLTKMLHLLCIIQNIALTKFNNYNICRLHS